MAVAVEATDRDEDRTRCHLARVVGDASHVEIRGTLGHGDPARGEEVPEVQRRSRPSARSAVVYTGSARRNVRYSAGDGTVSCAPTQRRTAPAKPRLNR